MKILLMIFLLPITVYAAASLFGSASATIENRKGIYAFSTEEDPMLEEEIAAVDAPVVDVDFGSESTELFTTPDYESDLIVDEPNAEEQDLAGTEVFEE